MDWVCCEGLSGSCYETVTSVGAAERTRSLAKDLVARRDRPSDCGRPGVQGGRSVVVFGCASAGGAARLRSAKIHEQGERGDDCSDQGYDERFVSPFPAGEAGDRQRRPTRKLMNTEAAKYRTCCWSRAPVDVVTMIRKAGPRTLVDGGRGRFTFWLARSRGWCRRRGR
jgi:hypothetical protein